MPRAPACFPSLLVAACMFPLAAHLAAAEVSVQAAASLTDAMKEIGAAYEKETGDQVQFNFGASSMLARQIEQGAPADLFLSADEAKMDALEQAGLLLAGTRRDLLSNSLVIIVPADSRTIPQSAAELVRPEFDKLALAEPQSVPAGIYAREYLEKLGLWAKLKGKIVPTENVRAALAAVESGNCAAGFVYKTDAMLSKKVKVALALAASDGPKITYPLAVLKSSREPERAQAFAKYLEGAQARKIFEKFGFSLVP
ncbi:MAG: molybdate ABC transporter substrate-binding protein [Verrucomicrobiota bacterium]|nr:molybdate ABC transporter substrate-binding protein [Verrucomicrobiota bacterium]